MRSSIRLTDDSGGAVANLVILTLAELHHELGDLVVHVHHLQDRGAVIGDGDVAVRRHHQLVEALGTQ